jgi:flagellar hook-associated protein 1
MSINFSAFEVGRRALNANQLGINLTGNNISNINTKGYTRQSLQLAESPAANINGYAVGTGVTIAGVQAYRDNFIESRLQTETGISGRLTAYSGTIATVEAALQGTETSGLQNSLNGFFGSFRDLEANPDSVSLRTVATQKGETLASSFQTTRAKLSDIRHGTDGQIRTKVEEVNSLTQKVADLNKQIHLAESAGGNASALRDERTEIVKQVSEITGARSVENQDGTVTLTIGEGRALVIGDQAHPLEIGNTPPLGLANLTLDGGQPAVFDEGILRGLQDAVSFTSSQINSLDGLASAVASGVNTLHTSGTDLNNSVGVNFFNVNPPTTAANISINAAITANPRLVVASPLAPPSATGTVAGAIGNLLTDQTATVGPRTGSFSSIFSSILAETGEKVSSANSDLQTQTSIISQLNTQRESVSGVSLDEEAINLMQYQKAFEAAARFIKVADEMTDTILSLAQ